MTTKANSLLMMAALFMLGTLSGCAADSDETTDEEEPAAESTSELLGGSESAPACVVKTKDDYSGVIPNAKKTVTIENRCKFAVKVGLDISLGADTECVGLKSGGTSTWTFKNKNPSVRKIKKC